eukprot:7053525-Pyramimonas_sp.AAC.1
MDAWCCLSCAWQHVRIRHASRVRVQVVERVNRTCVSCSNDGRAWCFPANVEQERADAISVPVRCGHRRPCAPRSGHSRGCDSRPGRSPLRMARLQDCH